MANQSLCALLLVQFLLLLSPSNRRTIDTVPMMEEWSKMGVRTRISTRDEAKQPVLVMVTAIRPPLMAARNKGVHGHCMKENRNDERRPCKSKEVDTEGISSEQSTEWIGEESEEDGCGGVDEELSEIEDKL